MHSTPRTFPCRRRLAAAVLAAAIPSLAAVPPAIAAPGDADPAFGTSGVALSSIGDEGVRAMALQADGRILVATLAERSAAASLLRITRFTTAGVVDGSFGSGGIAEVTLGIDTLSEVRAMLRQNADGKIVVAGRSLDAFAVTRLTTAGAVDAGFGNGGTAKTSISGDDEAWAIEQQADGRIVVAGGADDGLDSDFAVVRYTTAGGADSTFSGDGIATVEFGGLDIARAVAVQADGKIVVAGSSEGSGSDIALARLTTSGGLDATFGTGGKVTTAVTARDDVAWAVVVQAEGKIVVAGESDDDFVLLRYTSAGQLDTGFGSGGVARTDLSPGAHDGARALVRQADGRLVAAGESNPGIAADFAVVRYTTAGQLDSTFGSGGIVTTSVAAIFDEELRSLLLQGDGKLLAAGLSEDGLTSYQVIARYLTATPAVCGNGVLESPEQCDMAAANGGPGSCCSAGCTFVSSATACRAAAGSCDVAENCTGTSAACPADSYRSSTTTCRASAGTCDVAETCNGTSTACPADAFAASTLTCRSGSGDACDPTEKCNGTSPACPADTVSASTVVCRPASSACDAAEHCTGIAGQPCPFDLLAPAATPCTADTNACTTDACDGFGVCVGNSNTVACDDADPCTAVDACSNGVCTGTGSVCGNGVVQAGCGEACDDGNASNTDACLNNCAAASCGDGFVRSGVEQCDDGNASNTDACTSGCKLATCGDGFVRSGVEGCDDANTIGGDGCSPTCQLESCGDGVANAGEDCDDANTDNTDSCLDTCVAASCGDGFVRNGVEQCDDGNASDTDACLASCQDATCGDGFVRAGVEECDDGNASNTDACLSSCTSATCGDGFVRSGVEQCDDGNASNTDACLASCEEAVCGDGFVKAGVEQCDDGNLAPGDGCSPTCVAGTICGDADGNGSVQASDALRALRSAVGQPVTCPADLCDVDASGAVKASDALLMLRKAVGQPIELTCPDALA